MSIKILGYVEYCIGRRDGKRYTKHVIVFENINKGIYQIEFVHKRSLFINEISKFKGINNTGYDKHPILLIPKENIYYQEEINYDTIKRIHPILGWNIDKNIVYYDKTYFNKVTKYTNFNYQILYKSKFELLQMRYNSAIPKNIIHLIGYCMM